MSFEKNGAISSNTPQAGRRNNSGGVKQANVTQLKLRFPEDEQTADMLDDDLIKNAVEVVKHASNGVRQ